MIALLTHIRIAVTASVLLIIICCGIYPLVVWGTAQVLFRDKANGSLLSKDGVVVGSSLIAQGFSDPKYFHPRPSAAGSGYDATSSGGTNYGPTSDRLINGIHRKTPDGKDDPNNFDGIKDVAVAYRLENGLDENVRLPVDSVTRSASGLDPHISYANAVIQAARVAKARNIPAETVAHLIAANTNGPDLWILGEPGVNVLTLNLALDAVK